MMAASLHLASLLTLMCVSGDVQLLRRFVYLEKQAEGASLLWKSLKKCMDEWCHSGYVHLLYWYMVKD